MTSFCGINCGNDRRWEAGSFLALIVGTRHYAEKYCPVYVKKAKRKNLTVQKALQDNRWISHIIPLNTAEEIREYVELWEAIGKRSLTRTGKIVFGDDGRQTANTQPRVRTTINSKELSAN